MYSLTIVIQKNLRRHSNEIRAWKGSLEAVQRGGKMQQNLLDVKCIIL